jgi:hypothetical protein
MVSHFTATDFYAVTSFQNMGARLSDYAVCVLVVGVTLRSDPPIIAGELSFTIPIATYPTVFITNY